MNFLDPPFHQNRNGNCNYEILKSLLTAVHFKWKMSFNTNSLMQGVEVFFSIQSNKTHKT